MSNHNLELTDYELANLKAMIEACGYSAGRAIDALEANHPLQAFNNGDWVGQIGWKLSQLKEKSPPNQTYQQIRDRAFKAAQRRWIHKPENVR